MFTPSELDKILRREFGAFSEERGLISIGNSSNQDPKEYF